MGGGDSENINSLGSGGRTFEARPLVEGVDVGGSQAGPGVVGGREGEAVGRMECQRGEERFGHGIFEGIGCLGISLSCLCLIRDCYVSHASIFSFHDSATAIR